MLNENEWNLMKDLVKILEKFEIVTKLLGGSNYITISLVYPMILSLKNHIKEMLDCYQDNENDENSDILIDLFSDNNITNIQREILEEFDEIPDNTAADIIKIDKKGQKKKLDISKSIETDRLIILVIKVLEIAINKYWTVSTEVGLISTILDPRTKKLQKFTDSEKLKATTLLINKYEIFKINNNDDNNDLEIQNNVDLSYKNDSIMNMILGDDDESSDENDENEVDNYLKMKSNRKIIPLIWWENNKTKFPFLSQLAKEYLGITATLVLSEYLFSAIGNVISIKEVI